jgi:hypothetical protein
MTEQPSFNDGQEWSKKDLFSLSNRIEHGRSIARVAAFLMRTETEVRAKIAELGLKPLQILEPEDGEMSK